MAAKRLRKATPTPLTPTAAETTSTPRAIASGASSQPRVALVEPIDEAAGKGEPGERKDRK